MAPSLANIAADADDKGIDILAGVVEGEAGVTGSLDTYAAHQGLLKAL